MSASDGEVSYAWQGSLASMELAELVASTGGRPETDWWDRIRLHSLGWVTARTDAGTLVGFVNVAWDGDRHAFMLDTMTHRAYQRRGIATKLVEVAVTEVTKAGCEWLHVDFPEELAEFYFGSCGFRSTAAGLLHLPSRSS
jgi:GNAT superfamily N-acetyltransferase